MMKAVLMLTAVAGTYANRIEVPNGWTTVLRSEPGSTQIDSDTLMHARVLMEDQNVKIGHTNFVKSMDTIVHNNQMYEVNNHNYAPPAPPGDDPSPGGDDAGGQDAGGQDAGSINISTR
jgi:hypothetical protein